MWVISRPLARPSRSESYRRGCSSRSKQSPCNSAPASASLAAAPVPRTIEEYVRGLGLDAYLVGGAVRDELLGLESKDADFLVLGVDTEQLRAALAPHGRVEDLVVAGRLVGVRLPPRHKRLRARPRAGIAS